METITGACAGLAVPAIIIRTIAAMMLNPKQLGEHQPRRQPGRVVPPVAQGRDGNDEAGQHDRQVDHMDRVHPQSGLSEAGRRLPRVQAGTSSLSHRPRTRHPGPAARITY